MSLSSSDLLTVFRDEVVDSVAPYLWSTERFYQYLDEAQNMFYRLVKVGIEDARTANDLTAPTPLPLCQVSIVPGTEWYKVSPKILKVRTATRGDTGRAVRVLSPERLEEFGVFFGTGTGAAGTGTMNSVIQGMSRGYLRIYPVPNETVTLNLAVERMPLLTIDDDDLALEVDDQHLLSLLLWCKHKAYDKQDVETYDKDKSISFKQRFEAYCEQAKREMQRARHNPGPIAYGGIGNTMTSDSRLGTDNYYNRR